MLRVTAVGLCGSDLHWFEEAGIGDARLSRPLVLGHEFAGVIAAGPRSGERVAADPANNCDRCGPCLLARRGVSVEILNVHTIKPIDRDGILASCLRSGCVMSVEEHSIVGGLGSAIAELLAKDARILVPLRRIGVADSFGESGTAHELLEFHHLTSEHIVSAALAFIGAR
jgi:NADPH:quinone reductase-like Zn-dependent oxidoreductase